MENIGRKCGLSALVVLLCLWAMAGVGLGTPGGPGGPSECPPCVNCTHCGGAAANWHCVTNCNKCQYNCPCEYMCDDPGLYYVHCVECDLGIGCVYACDYWDECEDCNTLVAGGQCQSRCNPEDDCCHGQCCQDVQCQKCNDDPNYYRCVSKCDPNETCCYGKCCDTRQCLECNGDPNNPQCRSACDPEDECCYGTCCDYDLCLECNGDPNNPQCRSACDPNETCCYGKCCNTKQCLECNGDPNDPQCRSACDPEDECCYGTCCDYDLCLECNGDPDDPQCRSKCDPNDCEVCDGQGDCYDRCTVDPNVYLECDGQGNCICSNCWEIEDKYPNTISDCPACSNSYGGCYGSQILITDSFSYYTGFEVGANDVGWCVKKTKMQVVGYHIFCVAEGLDISPIIECAEAVLEDSGCVPCIVTRHPFWCMVCAAYLYNAHEECIQEPCNYVESCESCALYDTECSCTHEEEVVDWDQIPPGLVCIK